MSSATFDTDRVEALTRLSERTRAATLTPEAVPAGRYLALADPQGAVRYLALAAPVTRLGRAFDAHVRLDDHSVSRRHALIFADAEGAVIVDESSLNGTFVAGERVASRALRDGDEIVLGRVRLRFVVAP
jgi:pSer/pThr/pTyr-binding forkhead associated (FHA) protein